jgi:predicted oxidoreductase
LQYVDLFLIHSPNQHEGRLKEVWKEIEDVQKAGLARSIGVSNFSVQKLEEILDGATVVPAVNQVCPSESYIKVMPSNFHNRSSTIHMYSTQLNPFFVSVNSTASLLLPMPVLLPYSVLLRAL